MLRDFLIITPMMLGFLASSFVLGRLVGYRQAIRDVNKISTKINYTLHKVPSYVAEPHRR